MLIPYVALCDGVVCLLYYWLVHFIHLSVPSQYDLLIFLETRYGLGRHISTVSPEDLGTLLKVRSVEHVLTNIHELSASIFGL